MGRHPKPDEMKVLQGTDRDDRMNFDQPSFPIELSVDPPSELSPAEAEIWRELVPQLSKARVYTSIDIFAISSLCVELARYWYFEKYLKGKDLKIVAGKIVVNNDVYKARQSQQMAWKNAYAIMIQYGLTPVARQKLKVEPPDDRGSNAESEALPPKPSV